MIQDKRNHGTGYEEKFDVARFEFIADAVKNGKGTTGLSDIECFLHGIMKDLLESKVESNGNNNRVHHWVEYEARFPRGGGGLLLRCDTSNLNEVKKAIDESENRAINKGYKPTQYLIVKIEGHRITDSEGRFLKCETVETAVEYYPR